MLKLINRILLISILVSCSQLSKEDKKPKWNYPPDNPFPTIFTVRKYKDENIGLTAKLKPETIKMSCRLRNDSPYYWCDFEGELLSPDPKLPKKINSTFHVVVAKTGKEAAINFARRVKNNNKPVVIVLQSRASKSDVDNSIYSMLFGIYNDRECFDVFHRFSLCPKNTKKLDIFSGEYLE